MSDVTVKLNWNGDLKFTGVNSTGLETVIDGDGKAGASPVQALLEALGACAAVDVVLILQKMRTPAARLEMTLDGDRHSPEPRYYTSVRARFDVWGDGINPDKLARAIDLSFSKYCSVYHSLRPEMKLSAEYRLHPAGAEAADQYKTVLLS